MKVDLTNQDRATLNDVINICWQAGAVKNPQMGQQLEILRVKILAKPEIEETEKK